jgi:hypothetical protein
MEEELLTEWKTRVKRSLDETLPVSTIIQSSLIKELALSICSTGGELFAPSDVAFVVCAYLARTKHFYLYLTTGILILSESSRLNVCC